MDELREGQIVTIKFDLQRDKPVIERSVGWTKTMEYMIEKKMKVKKVIEASGICKLHYEESGRYYEWWFPIQYIYPASEEFMTKKMKSEV